MYRTGKGYGRTCCKANTWQVDDAEVASASWGHCRHAERVFLFPKIVTRFVLISPACRCPWLGHGHATAFPSWWERALGGLRCGSRYRLDRTTKEDCWGTKGPATHKFLVIWEVSFVALLWLLTAVAALVTCHWALIWTGQRVRWNLESDSWWSKRSAAYVAYTLTTKLSHIAKEIPLYD